MNDHVPAFNLDEKPEQVTPLNIIGNSEVAKAVQEIQAALVIAKSNPRDEFAAYNAIMSQCKRLSLARQAMYSYPKGGQIVTGPSIRLAEAIARSWGNISCGVSEIERTDQYTVAEAYAWDMQTNTPWKKKFQVYHEIMLKGGKKKRITDPREIYELVANYGSRRLRACILSVIPNDIVEDAVLRCKKTIAEGDGDLIENRIRKMIEAFKGVGINQDAIEKRLRHKIDATTTDEIVELTSIFTSIRDGVASRKDFFDIGQATEDDNFGPAADLNQALSAAKKPIVESYPKQEKKGLAAKFDKIKDEEKND